MQVELTEDAVADLNAGRGFYDLCQRGMGDYFLAKVLVSLDTLPRNAGTHSKLFGFHHMKISRFPYDAYYKVIDGVAIVFAILDLRQDPDEISDTLSSRS